MPHLQEVIKYIQLEVEQFRVLMLFHIFSTGQTAMKTITRFQIKT